MGVVRHLVSRGHTAIAHIAGPNDLSTRLTRRQAFVAWMNSEGLEARPELIIEAEGFRTDAGRAACDRLLNSEKPFTAIVAGNDLLALGCYDALADRRIGVPDEVSVTGYNDMTFIDRVSPPLTTVAIPFRDDGNNCGKDPALAPRARGLADRTDGHIDDASPYARGPRVNRPAVRSLDIPDCSRFAVNGRPTDRTILIIESSTASRPRSRRARRAQQSRMCAVRSVCRSGCLLGGR